MKGVLGLIAVAISSTVVFLIFLVGIYWAGVGGLQEELYIEMDSSSKDYEAETALNAVLNNDDAREYLTSQGDLDQGDSRMEEVQNYLTDSYEEWKLVVEKESNQVTYHYSRTDFPGGVASTYVASPSEDPVKVRLRVGDRK